MTSLYQQEIEQSSTHTKFTTHKFRRNVFLSPQKIYNLEWKYFNESVQFRNTLPYAHNGLLFTEG